MNIRFDIDAKDFEDKIIRAFEKAKPEIAKELLNVAKEVQRSWAAAVSGGAPISGMTKKVSDERYAQSVLDPTAITVSDNGMEVTITPREQERVRLIEEGHPQWDMKPSLLARKSAKTVGASRTVNVPITIGQRGTRGRTIGQPVRFRRVSTKTAPGKWVQKAVPPNPVVASVQREAESKVEQIVVKAMSKYL